MPDFAVHDGSLVVNVIVADSQQIAEEVTGLSAIQTDGAPWLGWTMEPEGWRPPAPFPSWSWTGSTWQAPVPYPTDAEHGATWDEDAQAWIEMPTPEPASPPEE